MLKCENIRPQLSAYLDREMPLWKLQLIQWHLKRCPICAHEVMHLQQTEKMLRQLDPVRTSDDFLSEVMHQMSTISVTERQGVSSIRRIFRKLESSLAWLRYSFWMRPASYGVGFALALFVTIASIATFYQPLKRPMSSDEGPMLAKSQGKDSIIHVEIISMVRPPKRHLSPHRRPIIQKEP